MILMCLFQSDLTNLGNRNCSTQRALSFSQSPQRLAVCVHLRNLRETFMCFFLPLIPKKLGTLSFPYGFGLCVHLPNLWESRNYFIRSTASALITCIKSLGCNFTLNLTFPPLTISCSILLELSSRKVL